MGRGRKPSIRYWQRKGGGFFTTIAGEQVELALGPDDRPKGPTYTAAFEMWQKLQAMETHKGSNRYLISALFNQYRSYIGETRTPERVAQWETYCSGFSELYGHLPVEDLRAFHFSEWWRANPQWNPSTRNTAGRLVLVAFNWAAKQGYIATNPVAGKVELPKQERRGREARMSAELCDLILGQCRNEAFRRLLFALWQTGARPSEIWKAEKHNHQPHDNGTGYLRFAGNAKRGYVWKNARKTGKDRVVCFTPEMTQIVEQLVATYPAGPLFRTLHGATWTKFNIHAQWKRLINKPAVVEYCQAHDIVIKSLVPYNFRHTFISDWLDAGLSSDVVATLCGTSVNEIYRTYGHPDEKKMHAYYLDFMRDHHSSRV